MIISLEAVAHSDAILPTVVTIFGAIASMEVATVIVSVGLEKVVANYVGRATGFRRCIKLGKRLASPIM